MTPANDPVIRLVETSEADAIDANVLDPADRDARRALRVALLDAYAESQRAQRLAVLMARLEAALPAVHI